MQDQELKGGGCKRSSRHRLDIQVIYILLLCYRIYLDPVKTLTLSSMGEKSLSPAGAAGTPKGMIALDCQSPGKLINSNNPLLTSWFIPPKCCKEAPSPSFDKAVQTMY